MSGIERTPTQEAMIQQLIEFGFPRHDAADALDMVGFTSVEEAERLIQSEAHKYDASQQIQQTKHTELQEPDMFHKALKLHHMRAEVEKIVAMGFSEEVANAALTQSGGDVAKAIICLLGE